MENNNINLLSKFEALLLKRGIDVVYEELKKEILSAEKDGRNHIMSGVFVDVTICDLIDKIDNLTLNNKPNEKR